MEKMSVNGKDYEILKLLGHGKGGYSYLATDGSQNYVLKQIHHEPCSYYTFGNKIEAEKNDYGRLAVTGIAIPKMIEIDEKNERILKEYIDGPTIYELVLNDRMEEKYFSQIKKCAVSYTLLILILIIFLQILLYRKEKSIILIMNVITIWKNGILKTGE